MKPAPSPHVLLAVCDSGSGMEAETQRHIFEPFFTTKEHGKGTGLGLATVYGIVKQNGGDVWVKSEPGRGARFEIYLPVVHEVVQPEAPPAAPHERAPGSETVLLVEDEKAVRDLARRVLEGRGYAVLVGADADQALELSRRHQGPIDILVTDVVMPGLSGPRLADVLLAERPSLKVLFTSGYAGEEIANRGVLPPETQLLQKPFTPRSLAQRVREILDARGR